MCFLVRYVCISAGGMLIVKLLCHWIWNSARWFLKQVHQLTLLPAVGRGPAAACLGQHLVLSIFHFCHLMSSKWYFFVVFICVSHMVNELECIHVYWLSGYSRFWNGSTETQIINVFIHLANIYWVTMERTLAFTLCMTWSLGSPVWGPTGQSGYHLGCYVGPYSAMRAPELHTW